MRRSLQKGAARPPAGSADTLQPATPDCTSTTAIKREFMVANDNEPWMRVSKTLCGSVYLTDAIPMAASDCLLQIVTMLSLPLHHVHRVLCLAVQWYLRR
jgi:hypothetical protein